MKELLYNFELGNHMKSARTFRVSLSILRDVHCTSKFLDTSTIWLKNSKERISYQAHSSEINYYTFESKTLQLTIHRISMWTGVTNLSLHNFITLKVA